MTNFQGLVEFKVNPLRYILLCLYYHVSAVQKCYTEALGEGKGRKGPRDFINSL